jgi:acetylornithine deacetylase/succinyl-diaminopimelate desuccinylase-like protein
VTTDRPTVEAAVDWLVETYADESDGADVLRDESGDPVGALISFGPPGSDRLVFYNYVDVVPAGNKADWDTPPFSPIVADGRLYARGAASNKGDLVARLEAASALRASGRLRREIVCWIDAAEESGSPSFASMLDRWRDRLRAPLVLWNTGFVNAAGEPVVATGFKGALIARVEAQATGYTGHSGVAGGASAVADLVRALAPLLDSSDLAGFMPARAFDRTDLEEDVRMIDESGLFPDVEPEVALLRSSANVPWIQGGDARELTRYAPTASCAVELRLVPPHRACEARSAIERLCAEAGFEATTVMEIEPYSVDRAERQKVVAQLAGPLRAAFGKEPRVLPIAPFSANAAPVADVLGAAVVSVGLSDQESRPHEANESISIERFLAARDFATHLGAS